MSKRMEMWANVATHVRIPVFFCLVFITLFSKVINSAPLLSEPIFLRLSTEQGLSQDSINALLIDQQGFLWIATYDGLNRYDGYRVDVITGTNNEFLNISVDTLFQDSKGYLWIGTEAKGVFQYNLATGETIKIAALQNLLDPDFLQFGSQILEDKQGDIWIVLDQTIVKYSYQTQSLSTVFELDSESVKNNSYVRWTLLYESTLFIATLDKLLALDTINGQLTTIDYMQSEAHNSDQINSKFLLVDNNRLWIGTVEGLYSMPLDQTMAFVEGKGPLPRSTVNVTSRNIWRIVKAQNGLFYLATDKGLFSYDPQTSQLQHLLLPTDSREYLATDVLKEIIIDDRQNFWLGTESDGALYWSPKTTLFTHIFNARGGRVNKVLSSNEVWSVLHDGNDGLWVGTRNGLNYYNLNEGDSQSFLTSADEKAQYSSSFITKIFADKNNDLWLLAGRSIVHFDAQTKDNLPLKVKSQQDQKLLTDQVYEMRMQPNGDILFFNNVGLYRYLVQDGEIHQLETAKNAISIMSAIALLPPLADQPNTTLFSSIGQLWQINNQTNQFTLIHSLTADQHRTEISADSTVIDRQGVLWIAYPGLGLIGLDNKTKEQKYFFNRANLLPTNSIYGLQLDDQGSIWMSSHAGILKFNPESQHLQKYGVAQGLRNLEFNQYTNVRLPNGKMVYGSPKGLTMFNPAKLGAIVATQNQVRITSIGLASRFLPMPTMDLAGQNFKLTYEDVGLKIQFSSLEFEDQGSTRYGYSLTGASNVAFTETRVPEVMFPKLGPGNYTFSVLAFDTQIGTKSKEATITFAVGYAPWQSPLAILAYVICAGLIVGLLVWRKRQNDLTLRAAHLEAVESKNKLTLALSASNSGIWEFQVVEQLFFAPRLVGELGYSLQHQEVKYTWHLALIHDEDRTYYDNQWEKFFRGEVQELDVTFRMQASDGSWIWYRDLGSTVQSDQNGLPLLVTGTYTNVTDNLANQENLRLFGQAFKHTHDWVLICNSKYFPIASNDAFKSAFNIKTDEDLGVDLAKLKEAQHTHTAHFWSELQRLQVNQDWKGEDKILFLNGIICDVLVHINAVPSLQDKNRIEYYLLILSDISEQKKAQEKLTRLANYDSLTGLPNRALLLDRVDRGLEHANRYNKSMALFFIDLDKFKQVNDSLGHKAGDELLKIVSQRLTNKLRKEDTVARLGGDEFVIMLEDVSSPEAISALVKEISLVIDLPILLSNQTVSVSSSIGIAMYPGDGKTAEELLKNADIAMYHAKEQGRSNFQFFTAKMDAIVKERLALENKLKVAQQHKRFLNYYQPIIDISSGTIEGFEILMRWPSKNGMISPARFIPIAEELGLIEVMTLDAFERSMPVLKSLRTNNFVGYLSVNLSARHFENQSSIDRIMLLLEQHEIPVSAIRFEITESALMRDYEKALEFMLQIQQRGFIIALDDFGTGFSSLKYLKEFPINVIKVDKSFVDDIGKSKNNESIILTTLSMAQQLNMSCVAEGIETAEQVAFFRQHNCFHLQGYYFSKPVPEHELLTLLNQQWS
ncbi:EAL domain-containing protein [Paraglaciecola sp.]|uniref:EAL domain-containing protein n=1 Tax=Paraglaciecola sp. TaxID=1920173 RepID=UPI0030F48C57